MVVSKIFYRTQVYGEEEVGAKQAQVGKGCFFQIEEVCRDVLFYVLVFNSIQKISNHFLIFIHFI